MIGFTRQKSASSARQVISIFGSLDADKYMNLFCYSGLRQVFASSARQVRQVLL